MTSRPGRVPSTRSDSQPATHRANPRPDDMTRWKTAGRKTDGKDGRAQPLFAAARDQGHAWFRLRRLRRSVANVHDGARDCTAGPVQHGLVRRRRRGGGRARVLLPSLAVHTVGLLTLLAAAHWRTPRWSLFAAATITGIAIPPVSSCVRARWALVAPD